jgi:hypothetical protein
MGIKRFTNKIMSLYQMRKRGVMIDNGTHYVVKVDKEQESNLTFDSRVKAREYKRILKSSKANISSYILKRTFVNGFIYEEKKVS